jgi:hypothetical protein
VSTSFSGDRSIARDFLAYGAISVSSALCQAKAIVPTANADETLGALIDGALITVFVGIIMLGFPH